METSNPNATSSPSGSAVDSSRRRSGRVVKAPQKFSPEPQTSSHANQKRKRGAIPDDDDDDDDDEMDAPDAARRENDDALSDEADENDDDDDDDPELEEGAAKTVQKPRSRKPAAKRAKVNGDAPAVRLPNRPKKTVRLAIGRHDDDGLYCKKRPSRPDGRIC
jgi:cohesin complex subunit SA-1/2